MIASDERELLLIRTYGLLVVDLLFADGEIWALRADTPVERIAPFFTIEGAHSHSRRNDLEEYRIEKWASPGVKK